MLLKTSDLDELPPCLEMVRSGRRYLAALIAGGNISDLLIETMDLPDAEALIPCATSSILCKRWS